MLPLIYSVWFLLEPAPLSSLLSILCFIFSYSSLCAFLHIILQTAVFPFFPPLYSSWISSMNCVALVQAWVSYLSIFLRLPYPIFHDSPKSGKFQPSRKWFSFWSPLWCSCGNKKELMLSACSSHHIPLASRGIQYPRKNKVRMHHGELCQFISFLVYILDDTFVSSMSTKGFVL